MNTLLVATMLLASPGQCLNGQCPPVGVPQAPVLAWQQHDGTPDQYDLMLGRRQVGAWNAATGTYRPLDGDGNWGDKTQTPIAPPVPMRPKAEVKHICAAEPGVFDTKTGTENYGVDTSKINGPAYSRQGREVTKEHAIEAVSAATLADDSRKLRLTVIGPKATCDKVKAELAPDVKSAVEVFCVEPTNPLVSKSGFRTQGLTAGDPVIYVQAVDGKVLHRQDSYEGPEKLAEAVRKANAAYDPSKDPNLNSTDIVSQLLAYLKTLDTSHWLTGGGIVALILMLFKKKEPAKTNGQ